MLQFRYNPIRRSTVKQRGRKSITSLQVAPPAMLKRAVEPDSILTPEQREIWDSVIESKPADWFTSDTIPLLEGMCRAVAMGRWLAARITEAQAVDPVDLVKLNAMLKMQDREQRGASSLATKLRLTIQSRWQPSTASIKHEGFNAAASVDPKTGKRKLKPWETA